MTAAETTEFLSTARQRFEWGRECDSDDRKAAEDDNTFANAEDSTLGQWEPKALASRISGNRPALQWNRIPTFVAQVANDGRQNRPAIKISRGDESATQPTADFFTNRIRQIEYESSVDIAKDVARDQQIISGRGFMRVTVEWIPGTQQQRICVDPIRNQFSVVWDPSANKYTREDADWCFVVSWISKDEHLRRFGPDSLVNHADFATLTNDYPGWMGVGKNRELIQVADYYLKHWETVTVPASDGQPARQEKQATVKIYAIDGAQVHDETDWLGSTIPIIPTWGREAVVNDKPRTFSLIRTAKSPQRSLNLAISNLFEQLGQQSKSPWLVPVGGIPANMEGDWANVHVTPRGYLQYNTVDLTGQPLPPPTRNQWEPPIQALVEACNQCIDGIKASMGIFDASLGARGNETSGIAIRNRQKESDVANFHFPDNEARSNKYLGEILVELIPKLDRPGAVVPVRDESGKTHLVPIGQPHQDPKTGETITHDLTSGQYGVTVSTGPSYTSQRQEAFDRDSQIIQAVPELMMVFGDLMFQNDDTAGAEERADRLKAYIQLKNPGLIKDPTQQQQIPPEVQQQFQQLQQQVQQTTAFAQSLHEKIQTDEIKRQTDVLIKQMELDFQREKLAVDDQNAKLKVASVEGIQELQQQIAVLMQDREMAHAAQQMQAQQAHAVAVQEAGQQHQADMQSQQQQAAAEAAETAQQQATEQEAPTEAQESA